MEPAHHRVRHLRIHLNLDPLLASICGLQGVEMLEDAHQRILHLELTEHSPQADSWPVVEWEKFPRLRRPCVVSIRPPLISVLAYDIRSSLEADDGVYC